MTGNLGYCLAAEKLAGIEVPERASYLRVIFAELQRIASHCMANGTFVNDCGAWQTPLMYMFREREKILDLFEMTCGARLTTNYMRIGGVAFDVPDEWRPAIDSLMAEMPDRISEYEEMLLDNEILLARARDVGVLTPEQAINASASGPLLRGSGIAWDIRKADPYCVYDRFDFDIPVGHQGDCFDRFIVRLEEMRQSVSIIKQALAQLPVGPVSTQVPLALRPEPGEAYARIESPKGELGFYLVSDGGPAPYRWHVRSPSFINLSTLKDLSLGRPLADAIVILGSLDINVGEIDR
jgi:NADH-quinone oxidoreductase subunit D